jgi:hypothetical protein
LFQITDDAAPEIGIVCVTDRLEWSLVHP